MDNVPPWYPRLDAGYRFIYCTSLSLVVKSLLHLLLILSTVPEAYRKTKVPVFSMATNIVPGIVAPIIEAIGASLYPIIPSPGQ